MSITQPTIPGTNLQLLGKPNGRKYLHGVWRNRHGSYAARLHISKRKQMYLGNFPTEREAGLAYDRAARQHRPDLPLNFPLEQQPERPMTLLEERIMQPNPTERPDNAPTAASAYTFMVPKREAATFSDLFTQAMVTMNTENRSDVLRTATAIGLAQIVNPPTPEAARDEPLLPDQTVRNLAMLGSLLIAVRRMPQVAGALTQTIDTYLDAIGRDLDALSAVLDA